ncbi:MAG: hypothetical protein HY827_07910 [Actinobacteria bacterium]|nr:hypothetical protein [Actinomycetota bacterium]
MSEALEVRAEIAKIARLLAVEPDAVSYLDKIRPADLVKFREQLIELFYGGEIGGLQRFVGPSKILPTGLVASITQESVGPVLTARIAGLVDPAQAIAVVAKLPIEFLADVAVEIDPRRAARIIGGLSEDVTGTITEILIGRREYVALGRFVGFVSGATLASTFDRVSDADLLQTAFVMEDKDQLTVAVGMLPDKRLRGLIRAAGRLDMWAEAIDLVLHLDDEQYARVIDLVAGESDATLDALIRTACDEKLWSLVLPIASDMDKPGKVIDALLRADDAAIISMVDVTIEYAQWDELYALLEKTPDDRLKIFRKRTAKLKLTEQLEPVADLLE